MEVVVYSTLASAPGQVTVVADPDQPIDSLISAFCIERGIRHQKDYVLRNTRHELLPNTHKISGCGAENGDILYLGVRARNERWIGGCNQWWLLATIALLIGCAGLISISILKVRSGIQPFDYGIVIDAGSSHSQVYVYKWEGDKENGTAVPTQTYTCKSSGKGIAEYAADPTAAGESLVECLDNTKGQLPDVHYKSTPLILGATGGMRLLDAADHNASDAVLGSVRDTMSTYPYNFSRPEQQARILTGSEEGSFGWITVNYLLKRFGEFQFSLKDFVGFTSAEPSPDVVGAMDLGGASTQMTFVPENPEEIPDDYRTTLLLYGATYNVYSHSYLCYGVNEAQRQYKATLLRKQNYSRTIEDPCAPKDSVQRSLYSDIFHAPCTKQHAMAFTPIDLPPNTSFAFHGMSNTSACREAVQGIFNFSCSQNKSCSFNGIYQPKVQGRYLAFSAFYYTTAFFNLTGSFQLEEYRTAVDTFCKKSWEEIQGLDNPEFLVRYCMEGNYIDILLTQGYKFDSYTWPNIEFLNKIGVNDLGWSLGFMLNASNSIPADYPTQEISTVLFIILVILFACFIAVAVGFALYAMSAKKDKTKAYEKLSHYGSV